MKIYIALLLFFLKVLLAPAFAQESYFKKVRYITDASKTSNELVRKLDSVKLTRQLHNSSVVVTFNRDVDFGYKHQRIDIEFNGAYFHINLLTKNDSIYLKAVRQGNSYFESNEIRKWNNSLPVIVDTPQVLNFLQLRNRFYGSNKSITNLFDEINLNGVYSTNCGDVNLQTERYKTIKQDAKNNNQEVFRLLLNSISCEEQAYAALGYYLVRMNKFKVRKETLALVDHVNKRKSSLVRCEGCFMKVY